MKKLDIFLEKYYKIISNVEFQIYSIIIALCFVVGLFTIPFYVFNSSDEKPDLIYCVPQKGLELGSNIADVKTGLFINGFSEFDVNKNKFTFDGLVWFQFDPSRISFDTIDKFSFEGGVLVYKSPPETSLVNDELLVKYKIIVQFSSMLGYRDFPFDDHSIYITLINDSILPSEAMYLSMNSDLDVVKDIQLQGWGVLKTNVEHGYSEAVLDDTDLHKNISYPKVVFRIDVSSQGIRKVLIIVIPLLILFFLALFSLSIDTDIKDNMGTIVGLTTGSLTGLFAYRFVIESLSPSVVYFTITDYLYTFVLICTFLVFIYSMYLLLSNKKLSFEGKFVKQNLFLFFVISLIVLAFVLVKRSFL
ncbi:TPA: hypothetical protein DEO28_03710 [Candidatus Dependentiae bacterium]|nr:MAG: hypothetical protein UR14_C0007G0043 [candidate division TM6 bacterium GW2011_GWE2_31_21]KKP53596.1 MAG: hypothetical protein UR43_C0004G0137 [candidate division TM6 bacterium GW2011_GWF2_33_332]HBS48164.1 hypothetical protein [Candidatus Dependentiae bacterium]HBZ73588.1 hypothetical protein [Candidatus Dependentiae bacterium]